MIDGQALKRRREPEGPFAAALVFFGLIAASGFAVGWMAQALVTF